MHTYVPIQWKCTVFSLWAKPEGLVLFFELQKESFSNTAFFSPPFFIFLFWVKSTLNAVYFNGNSDLIYIPLSTVTQALLLLTSIISDDAWAFLHMTTRPPLLARVSVREREREGIQLQRTFDLAVQVCSVCLTVAFWGGILWL